MLQECLIKNFACKMRISCWINLMSLFFIRTLTFFFYVFLHSHWQHVACELYTIQKFV